jgi:hypothetical protein
MYKPTFKIGDSVNIVGCDLITSKCGGKTTHLLARNRLGEKIKYYIIDVELTIRLRTGETKSSYLISEDKESSIYSTFGWVSEGCIKFSQKEDEK